MALRAGSRAVEGRVEVVRPALERAGRKSAPPERALVDDAFSCYDKKVLVRQREALGDE